MSTFLLHGIEKVIITNSSTQMVINSFKLFTLFFTIFLARRWLYKNYFNRKYNHLPPSPPTFPIIGNLHQLGKFPHRSLHSLSQHYGDLMLIWLGSIPCLVLSSAESARELMTTNDLAFADRADRRVFQKLLYSGRDIASSAYNEYWRQMRSVFVIHLVSNARVRSFGEVRAEETRLMIDKIRKSVSRDLNFSEMIMTLMNDVVCRVAFGKKHSEGAGAKSGELGRILGEFVELFGGFYLGDFIPWMAWIHKLDGVDRKMERVAKELDGLLERIVQEHVDSGVGDEKEGKKLGKANKDCVDVLLELQKEEPTGGFAIDRECIKAIVFDAFSAGTDTTYSLLEWAMSELLNHPRTMKTLQAEVRRITGDKEDIKEEDLEKMSYLKAVIKETLRVHPPAPLLIPRAARQSVRFKGYEIPKGTQVIANVWAIQRDPKYWERPEEFWPERFVDSKVDFRGKDFQFIPFGAGRRGCPGISFAVATSELVLANLVRKFDWSLPGGEECEEEESLGVGEKFGITIHRSTPLVVVPSLPS